MNEKTKISLDSLTWSKTAMLCAILLCGGIAAYFGVNVNYNLTFEGRLYDVERALWVPVNATVSTLVKPCGYLIDKYVGGSTYYLMWNGNTGKLDHYDANCTAVINNAIGNLTKGGIIAVNNMTATLDTGITISNNGVGIVSYNTLWTFSDGVAAGACGYVYMFYAADKDGVYFDFVNSYVDMNIAGQTPDYTTSEVLSGIGLVRCTHVDIRGFNGTGFGGNKCAGVGVFLQNCTYVKIGKVAVYDYGSTGVSLQGCHKVEVDSVYGENYNHGPEAAGAVLDTWNAAGNTTSDITINSVMGYYGGTVLSLLGDYGECKDISVGKVVGQYMNYSTALVTSHIAGYYTHGITIDTVISDDVIKGDGSNAKGVFIDSSFQYQIYDVTIGAVVVEDSEETGITIYHSEKIQIGNVQILNVAADGIGIWESRLCDIDNIRITNCSSTHSASGVVLTDSINNTITVLSVANDGTTYLANHAVYEYNVTSDYNIATVYFAEGISGTVVQALGAHSILMYVERDIGVPYSYCVFTDGTNYYLKNAYGSIMAISTNASEIINWALGNVSHTSLETVYLKGDFTLSTTLTIYGFTTLLIDGNLTLADGADCDMIQNANPAGPAGTDSYITIMGVNNKAFLCGNQSGQTVYSNGINMNYTWWTTISNLQIDYFNGTGLIMEACGRFSKIMNCEFQRLSSDTGSYNDGVYLNNFVDSWFMDNYVEKGAYFNGGGNHFSNNYFGGGGGTSQVAVNMMGSQWENTIIDSSIGHGLYLGTGNIGLQFTGLQVTRPLTTGKMAINVEDCTEISMSNVYIGQKDQGDNTLFNWTYGIYEQGSSDYNTYNLVTFKNCTSSYTLGTHSCVNASRFYDVWYP